ncbi:MAG: polysaccharide biosynthesis/export family protein [Bryobacterales bacterium]
MPPWKRIVGIGLLCGVTAFTQSLLPETGSPQIGSSETGSSISSSGIGAGPYRVGAGDMLEISVFDVDELGKTVTVGSQGTLVLPLLGEVNVGGLTTPEIAARLETLYGESLLRDPQINVAVKEYRSQPVSVFGAVERPGIYQLQGRRRLLDVLAMAGGLARDAGYEVRLTRQPNPPSGSAGGEPVTEAAPRELVVAVQDLLTGSGEDKDNPWIEPYDVIRVAKTGLVYVLGAVARPGGYPLEQESMTVLRAISLAQGLDRRAAAQKARVIRQQGGASHEVVVRIEDILSGAAPDAPLVDNDILFVPDSKAKSALHRGAEAAIQLATGVIIWRR